MDKSSNETGLEEECESGGDDSNSEAADVIESENGKKGSINAGYRCKVDGCLLQRHGEDTSGEGSARAHTFFKCKASVHLYCCEKILGLVCNDSDDPLLRSMCTVDEAQQDVPKTNNRHIASQGEGTGTATIRNGRYSSKAFLCKKWVCVSNVYESQKRLVNIVV